MKEQIIKVTIRDIQRHETSVLTSRFYLVGYVSIKKRRDSLLITEDSVCTSSEGGQHEQ